MLPSSQSSHADKADVDAEKAEYGAQVHVSPEHNDYESHGLKRSLKPRHLTFISIGACIGTGIFLGIGSSLAKGGPLGLLMGFSLMCSVTIAVMLLVGEMVTFLPVPGGHIRLAGRFVDPALSSAMGINYYLCWVLILAAEISATAVLVTYWTTSISQAVWMSISLVVVLTLNLFGAKYYGEAEVWFASIKVVTMVGLIILGIILSAGGGPSHKATGFQYWRNPGPFVQYLGIPGSTGRFLGFFAVLTQAAFSVIGTEMLALAAAETKNPRKVLPQALRTVWIRIVVIYFMGSLVVGIIVASNNPRLGSSSTASASPYVIAIETAGIKALPSVINAAIITSALSAASSDLFTTSRTLHSLASQGHAPRIFSRTNRAGVPYVAVVFSWLFGCLAYLGVKSSAQNVFNFLVNLTALSGILTWLAIAITYLRFRRGMAAQGLKHEDLPWKSKLGYPAAIWVIFMVSVVTIFSGWEVFRPGHWDSSAFFSNYLPVMWFIVFYIGYKFYLKSKIVRASEMDFVSDLDAILADEQAGAAEDAMRPEPTTFFGKAMAVLSSI